VLDDEDFYRLLRDMALEIPDGHVNVSLNSKVFYDESAGSFGLVLKELSDGRVIVVQVIPDTPGENAGILPGAEITIWNGTPIADAISAVIPRLGPYSTDHTTRIARVNFLTRVAPDSEIEFTFINPGETEVQTVSLTAEAEYESLLQTFPSSELDEFDLPIEGEFLEEEGLAYISVLSFLGDYQLFARLWDHNLQLLVDEEIPGLIIDLRTNSGGRSDLPIQFADIFRRGGPLCRTITAGKQFEPSGEPVEISLPPFREVNCCPGQPGLRKRLRRRVSTQAEPLDCGGTLPTARTFEVGRGQYSMPGDISVSFNGKSLSLDGKLIIEGTGVIPQIVVPVTIESALGEEDAVLEAAIKALLDLIK
jgi:C-terminal processing protease CtpA/Prc